ncbi:acyl-CoA dehydrogenase family protein, partial [Tepidimonas sp.]|uniref:acyl-CoA dehydrogenase family protein n=1 Tax=Tepidimonas sp. TaxID=2002775 RepID=UPI0028CBC36D
EVNEVFLSNVRVPLDRLVGAENQGWTIAKYLLTYERTNIAGVGLSLAALQRLKVIARAVHKAGRPLIEDPLLAARLARVEIDLDNLQTTLLRVQAAVAGGGARDAEGLALFWVPRSAPGVTVRAYRRVDGGAAADLVLAAAPLPIDARVVGPAHAAPVLAHGLACGTLALCAEGLGAMEAAFAMTREYLQTRRQFGRPIRSFQALRHRAVDLWMAVQQARSAVINAAAALDDGDALERDRRIAAAKVTIGRSGIQLAEESIQLHGGMGMTWELPLARYAKRLVMIDHEYGDGDHHLARFMALSREREARG